MKTLVMLCVLSCAFSAQALANNYPPGKEFKTRAFTHGMADSHEEAAQDSDNAANRACRSGRATRISDYTYYDYDFTPPPDCRIIDDKEYCAPSDPLRTSTADATYRCR